MKFEFLLLLMTFNIMLTESCTFVMDRNVLPAKIIKISSKEYSFLQLNSSDNAIIFGDKIELKINSMKICEGVFLFDSTNIECFNNENITMKIIQQTPINNIHPHNLYRIIINIQQLDSMEDYLNLKLSIGDDSCTVKLVLLEMGKSVKPLIWNSKDINSFFLCDVKQTDMNEHDYFWKNDLTDKIYCRLFEKQAYNNKCFIINVGHHLYNQSNSFNYIIGMIISQSGQYSLNDMTKRYHLNRYCDITIIKGVKSSFKTMIIVVSISGTILSLFLLGIILVIQKNLLRRLKRKFYKRITNLYESISKNTDEKMTHNLPNINKVMYVSTSEDESSNEENYVDNIVSVTDPNIYFTISQRINNFL